MSLKEQLEQEIKEQLEVMGNLDVTTEDYTTASKNFDTLMKHYVELTKDETLKALEHEKNANAKYDAGIKHEEAMEQIRSENYSTLSRIGVSVLGIASGFCYIGIIIAAENAGKLINAKPMQTVKTIASLIGL